MAIRVAAVYADGWGRWHADIAIDNNAIGDDAAAERMAHDAIRAEVKARNPNDVLHGITLVQRVSQNGTLTNYYVETDTP